MRTKENIDRAYLLVDEAIASMARTRRTRTKAYKLLIEARDRLSNRMTPTDFSDMLKKAYASDTLDSLQANRFQTFAPKLPE
jgi:hypothetical protein